MAPRCPRVRIAVGIVVLLLVPLLGGHALAKEKMNESVAETIEGGAYEAHDPYDTGGNQGWGLDRTSSWLMPNKVRWSRFALLLLLQALVIAPVLAVVGNVGDVAMGPPGAVASAVVAVAVQMALLRFEVCGYWAAGAIGAVAMIPVGKSLSAANSPADLWPAAAATLALIYFVAGAAVGQGIQMAGLLTWFTAP